MKRITDSGSRIREMMEQFNITQAELARVTKINKSALSNYIHGTREPRQDMISLLADPFGVNPTWLMGYDVPMMLAWAKDEGHYISADVQETAQQIFENEDLRLLFDAAKDASAEDLQTVHQMLLALKRKEQN